MGLKAIRTIIIPLALVLQGLGVNTPMIFGFVPGYRRVFCRLWERHKNPVSWVCRPFFGLVVGYGAILQSWPVIVIGVLGIGTSWFWFPKLKNTPTWAEEVINKEFEVLTPHNRWDLRRVVLPSVGLPVGLAALVCLLWSLSYPLNWLGILITVVVVVMKIVWSTRLQRSILRPLTWVTLIGFGLGALVGALLFAFCD